MHLAERDQDGLPPSSGPSTEEGPALRDAAAAAERAARDDADATTARERLRDEGLPAIEPDDELRPHLAPGETIHALRRRAILKAPGGDDALGYGGTVYLTSQRVVHLGQVMVTIQLTDIVEAALAGERLLLTMRNGEGLALDVDRPRLLRVEIAEAARASRR